MDENAKRLMASLQRDPAKIQALLRSGDGQTLLRMLTERDQGAALQPAAQSAAQGQTEELQRMLSQVMGSSEGAALIQRIQKAVQTSRPKSTIRWQKSELSSGGRMARSCRSTCKGSLEPSVIPSRPVMRMQWVSQT